MQLSLKRKMVFSVIFAIAITAAILLFVGYQAFKTYSWQSIESESRNSLQAYSRGIADWFHDKQNTIQGLKEEIEKNPTMDVVPLLRHTMRAGSFGLSYYGNEQGDMFRQDPALNKPGYDPRVRGWYKQAKAAGKAITTPPYVSVTMKTLVVTLADPVFVNGQFTGVAASNLALDKLIKDVLAINAPGNGRAILVNGTGTIVAHQNKDLILKPIKDLSADLNIDTLRRAAEDSAMLFVKINGQNKVIMTQHIAHTDWYLVLIMDKGVLEKPLQSMLLSQVSSGALVLLVMALLTSWFVARQLLELRRVSDALADIAEGEGDLTQRIEVKSNDEVGMLATKFNLFVDRLNIMMNNVKRVSERLNDGADHAAEGATSRSDSVRRQQDEITMVATAVTEMASATAEIANNAENTAKNANHSVELTETGFKQMVKSQESINTLAQELNSAVGIIGELEEHGQQISSILATIRGIAEQTNLLALNAAIEAARAGEQGRGFAVVADEVRVLSQRTHDSTEEIEEKIQGLQKATGGAVAVMTQSHGLAETSVNDVNLTGESLTAINEAIRTISDMATQIAAAAEEQSLVTADINGNTESVREIADQLTEGAMQAVEQAKELRALAANLDEEISRFKL